MTALRTRLDQILLQDPYEGLETLQTTGELRTLLPEVQGIVGFGGLEEGHKDLWDHTRKVVSQCVPDIRVRWAALFHDVGKPSHFKKVGGEVQFHGHEMESARLWWVATNRLDDHFSRDERQYIQFLIRYLGNIEEYGPEWTDSAVRRLAKLVGTYMGDLVNLARADITTKHDNKRRAHHARMNELEERVQKLAAEDAVVPPLVTGLGNVLTVEFGVSGRDLGALLKVARDAVESGDLERQAEPSVVVAYLRQLQKPRSGIFTKEP
jgi:hypothetical protein